MATWRPGETATFTNGSKLVTGTGTTWLSAAPLVYAGYALREADGTFLEIASITSDTTLELVLNYAGTSGSKTIDIIPVSRAGIEATINRFFQTLLEIGDVGRTIHTVSGVPDPGLGKDGDSAIDPTALVFYSKVAGVWSSGLSMVGTGFAKDFVNDFGGDPTGVTDSDAAWDLMVAAGAGDVTFPNGDYVFTTAKVITAVNSLIIHGEAVGSGPSGGVVFRFENLTGDCIKFSNCQHSGIRNVRFLPTVRRTSGADIVFDAACFMCSVHDTRHENSWNAIHNRWATDTEIHRVLYRNQYGPDQILHGLGSSFSEASYRCTLHNCRGDNPYNVEPVAITHDGGLPVVLGNVIRETSGFYECTTAGTTAGGVGTGTPPTAPGGTTAAEGFTTEIDDGTAKWTFRGHAELKGLVADSYGYSLIINEGAFLNGWLGLYARDTVNAASNASVPQILRAYGVECDHNWLYGIVLANGFDMRLIAPWVSSSLDGNGIVIGSDFVGDFSIKGGRSFGCAEHGILVNGGDTWQIDDVFVSANSQKTPNTFHGITLGNNVGGGIVTNCRTPNIDGGGNPQAYGLLGGTGVDNCTIVNNDFRGNTSGGATGIVRSETMIFENNRGTSAAASGPSWEVLKEADQLGIGSSFVDISGLSFPIKTASGRYAFEFFILADCTNATTGIDVSFNGPAAPISVTATIEYWTAADTKAFQTAGDYNHNTASPSSPGAFRRIYKIEGMIHNGPNTGNLVARIKGELGTEVNVRNGSWGKIKRLA